MKRSLYIICLLFFALSARGVDYEKTEHVFNDSVVAGTLTFQNYDYHIGTMTYDGTVYTCMGAHGIFKSVETLNYNIYIYLQQSDSVIISFTKGQLSHFSLSYINFTGTIRIFVSSDGTTWTEKDPITSTSTTTEVTGLNGEKYIKIKNTSDPNKTLYISRMVYYSLPPCHCLRVVSE